jgi:hypothetical protein
MTTYSFTVELSEQELWSVEEALKFYMTPEAQKLREERPDLVRYAGLGHIKRILETRKLYEKSHMTSTSSFVFSRPQRESQEPVDQFIDLFPTITQFDKDELIEEVAVALLREPLPEFESGNLSQLIHSPSFEQLVLNQLMGMMQSDAHLIKSILNEQKHRYWFNEMVAKQIRKKQLNG